MERLEKWPYFRVALLGLLLIILMVNVTMFASIRKSLVVLENRSTSVSCPHVYGPFSNIPPDGVFSLTADVNPESYQDGNVQITVSAELTSKIPSSQIVLLHRVRGTTKWQETPMNQYDVLQYSASFLATLTEEIEYRLAQKVNGEIVHATADRWYNVGYLVGTGDVSIYYSKTQGSTDITWHFRQTPMSRIEDLQVKEIILKVDKAKPESFTLTKPDPDGEFTVTFKDEGFKSMEVTVVYKDGERRTAVYKAWDKIQEPFIKR